MLVIGHFFLNLVGCFGVLVDDFEDEWSAVEVSIEREVKACFVGDG